MAAAPFSTSTSVLFCVSLLLKNHHPTLSWIIVPTFPSIKRRTTWNYHHDFHRVDTNLWLGPKRASRDDELNDGDLKKNHSIDAAITVDEQVEEKADPSWTNNGLSAFSIDSNPKT